MTSSGPGALATTPGVVPQRLRLSRARGWRKPAGAVVVARPSRWGNPWRVEGTTVTLQGASEELRWAERLTPEQARARAVHSYGEWLAGRYPGAAILTERRTWILEHVEALRGLDLACWCPPGPCHADMLLALANGFGAS